MPHRPARQRRPMHIEHLIPRATRGRSEQSNLWLSCAWCNSYRGALIEAIDPDSGQLAALFNPRM
ncbi:HNH endonuclease [Thiorhodococcus minor]|uniref:HNH endonuclease n=1 Tax=Thiorhodococcus minor TaxID=57489 RepID=UPI003CC91A46